MALYTYNAVLFSKCVMPSMHAHFALVGQNLLTVRPHDSCSIKSVVAVASNCLMSSDMLHSLLLPNDGSTATASHVAIEVFAVL